MRDQDQHLNHSGSDTQVILMPGLFNQTVHLLLQARLYFSTTGRDAEQHMGITERARFATEMSRITIRLSSIMAWLSVQKAVSAGDITVEEAYMRYPLDGEELALESDIETEDRLPAEMRRLLEETRDLYERVYRLNQQQIKRLVH
jgi:regulator of CtrA degradation